MNADRITSLATNHPDEFRSVMKLAIRSPDPMPALELCLQLKEAGYTSEAETQLRLLELTHPTEPAISYELGIILSASNVLEAECTFLRALRTRNDFGAAFRALAICKLKLNKVQDFVDLMFNSKFRKSIDQNIREELSQFYHYISFLNSEKSSKESLYIDAVNNGVSGPECDVRITFERTLKAVKEQTPFALVRFGDGEGSMCKFTTAEEISFFPVLERQRSKFSQRWYGKSYTEIGCTLDIVMDKTRSALGNADIVAIPNSEWIDHEAINGNFDTFVSCVNAARAVRSQGKPLARTSVHYDLLEAGGLAEIVDNAERICIITSHLAMADEIEKRFPKCEGVEIVVIPGAYSDKKFVKYDTQGYTFLLIDDILCSIDKLSRNHIILVSVGFPGKLICLRLKDLGFIALVIGSVTDMILNLPTRPNFALYNPSKMFHSGVTFMHPVSL